MGLFQAIKREWFYTTEFLRILRTLKTIKPDGDFLTPDLLERTVDKFAARPAFIGEEGEVSYRDFDARANQIAHWALAQGLKPGDTVALYMGNRWDYIACWFGLSKVGVVAALINTHVTSKPLAHCLNISDAHHVIMDGTMVGAYATACELIDCHLTPWVLDGAHQALPGGQNFNAALDAQSSERPDRAHRKGLTAKAPCLKMYTSGTTGLPKAAIMAHTRAMYYLMAHSTSAGAKPSDRMIMVLPLYHATGGLCGVGCALAYGGALIIRPKFSASRFWDEAIEYGATMFMYVGELCRFLVSAEEKPQERQHKIRVAIGNGLRPDVWTRFVERTGIPRIMEFYGATEGNVGLVNLDSKPGAIGRIPPYLKFRFNLDLVKFDVATEEPIRDKHGRCIPCGPDEVGEGVGKIDPKDPRFRFDGYGDKKATEKKILHDVFKPGDLYFRTGDLMRRDKLGYYYFMDRVGDTFRWKSENVATSEVAEAIGIFPGVEQVVVYGVEIADNPGKAGMAALVINDKFDLNALHAHVHKELPPFARPLFLRIKTKGMDEHTTGTFKARKVELVQEGYDPAKIDEPVYFDDCSGEPGQYVVLTPELKADIESGKVRI
ncbi:long-chain-acyl-CoA synthetase [Woodsholea maritima]|uniref:long-chain-acyl-CoA synthetase n=1 Tax=Woodsholea maritima TaxID=240237 RepID=UPI00036D7144|nr:long-chain-acyl-CoA synthetase [Woodsholea maritima]